MASTILSIIALFVPLIIDWLEERDPYEEKQELRRAILNGDTLFIGLELDKLREEHSRNTG